MSETEYTGAGKHIQPQLDFARENGIEIKFGDPQAEDKPGENIILPKDPSYIKCKDADLNHFRKSLIKKAITKAGLTSAELKDDDYKFLAVETKTDVDFVKKAIEELGL